jgi:AcrR family transcriptional regulator
VPTLGIRGPVDRPGGEPDEVGRRQQITKERVVDVAVALLDADGPTGLSIERIGRELGVRGPSLYYHYEDKSAILDAVAARVIGDLDVRRPTKDWVEWIIENSIEFHVRVMAHPHVASLLIEHLSPRATLAGFGQGARLLTEAGVDPALQVLLLEGAQHLSWGFTLHRAVAAANAGRVAMDSAGRWPELAAARLADPWKDDCDALERAVRSFIDGVLARGLD